MAMPPSDIVSSPAQGSVVGERESPDSTLDADDTSETDERNDVTNQQRTRSGAPTRSRSPEHGPRLDARPGSRAWEEPPPAYQESTIHEESSPEEPPSSAISMDTGIEATFGRPSSLRAHVQEIFPLSSPSPPPTVAEPLVPPTSAQVVDGVTLDQSGSESVGLAAAAGPHDLRRVGHDTDEPVDEGGSIRGTFTSDQVDRILTETIQRL